MILDLLRLLAVTAWCLLLPAYLVRKVFLRDIESPAAATGLAVLSALVLLPLACVGVASLLGLPLDGALVLSVATAFNVFGMLHQAAAWRRRVREEE
ncbi:MAG: hypothetical protein FJ098_11330 [Deltaproteobacteria bacterium]|nr:hypothetical protein [Deltaproteobacteria bacterium]